MSTRMSKEIMEAGGGILCAEVQRLNYGIARELEQRIELVTRPKPWWMPRWLHRRLLARLLVRRDFKPVRTDGHPMVETRAPGFASGEQRDLHQAGRCAAGCGICQRLEEMRERGT